MEKIPNKIFKATVLKNETLARGVKRITLKLIEPFAFLPGQYVWVEISTMQISDTHGNRRAFSISSVPNAENTIEIVARVSESGYKQSLFALDAGNPVTVHGPFGSSFVVNENLQPENIFMIAGGVGIAAFISTLLTCRDKKYRTKCTLVYLNNDKETTPFLKELAELKKTSSRFDYVVRYDHFAWSDIENLNAKAQGDSVWWISGPQEMVDFVYSELEKGGVSRADMVFENFYPIKKTSLTAEMVAEQITDENLFVKGIQNSTNHTIITNVEGIILFANAATERSTGYSKEEILGNTPRLWGGLMSPEFYVDFWKKKISGEPFVGELINRRKNGETYHALAHIAPIFGKGKDIIGFIGTEEDISVMREQERVIAEKEERLKFALEGNRDGLWDWDIENKSIYFSPRWKELLGFKDTEVKDVLSEWHGRIFSEDLKQAMSDLQDHLEGKTAFYEGEYRMLCKDATYKWILVRGKVTKRDSHGKALRMVGTHTDISETKEREQELRQLTAAMVGRELKMVELKEELKSLRKSG